MAHVDFPSTTFTDVVVEFCSGRRQNLTVFYSINAVLKSLRQPPSFKNTIRLGIIESITDGMSDCSDLIKSIRVKNPFINYRAADRHIVSSTKIGHSWYFPDPGSPFQSSSESRSSPVPGNSWSFPDDRSCSESSDGCYTPDSATESPLNDGQPLAKRAQSHRGALPENFREGFICFSVVIGIIQALFNINSYLRAEPNFLDFEPCYRVLDASLTYIWIQACLFGFPACMFFSLWQVYRRERG